MCVRVKQEKQNKSQILTLKQKVTYKFQVAGLLLFLFNSAKTCAFVHTAKIPKPHPLRSPLSQYPIRKLPYKTLETITILQKTYDILFKIWKFHGR